MASKNFEMPLPFRLVKQVPPKAWELCEKCMELKSKMQWNDLCILPIGAGFSVADAIGYIPLRDAHKISALYAWRKYKEIYSFDDDFAQILMEQGEDDMDIPIDILLQLPYPYTKKPKDVFCGIRKWDVGFRIGNMIRKAKQAGRSMEQNTELTSRSGGTKAPHTRRGHRHHFWIGKMDGERKLILKWVAPMFINGNDDDVITTIHEVKGDNNV